MAVFIDTKPLDMVLKDIGKAAETVKTVSAYPKGRLKKKKTDSKSLYARAVRDAESDTGGDQTSAYLLFGLDDGPLDAAQGRELRDRGQELIRRRPLKKSYAALLAAQQQEAEAAFLEQEARRDRLSKWDAFRGVLEAERADVQRQYMDDMQERWNLAARRPEINDWEGRKEMIGEYRGLQQGLRTSSEALDAALPASYMNSYVDRADRLYDLQRQLRAMDLAAGNGPMAYSGEDRAVDVMIGSGLNIASSLASTVGTLGEAYGREQMLEQARNMDQTLLDRRLGESHEQRVREAQAAAKAGSPVWRRITDAADRLGDEAARDLERARGGLSGLGRAGVDIAEKAIELGFDTAVGAMTGGGKLPAAFVRTLGAAAQEARRDGADLDQQMLYGSTMGGLEVLPSVFFNSLKDVFDRSTANKITEEVVGKLITSPSTVAVLQILTMGVGGAAEMWISKKLEPIVKSLYQETMLDPADIVKGNMNTFDSSELLYEAFVGFALGMLEGGGEAVKNHSR